MKTKIEGDLLKAMEEYADAMARIAQYACEDLYTGPYDRWRRVHLAPLERALFATCDDGPVEFAAAALREGVPMPPAEVVAQLEAIERLQDPAFATACAAEECAAPLDQDPAKPRAKWTRPETWRFEAMERSRATRETAGAAEDSDATDAFVEVFCAEVAEHYFKLLTGRAA